MIELDFKTKSALTHFVLCRKDFSQDATRNHFGDHVTPQHMTSSKMAPPSRVPLVQLLVLLAISIPLIDSHVPVFIFWTPEGDETLRPLLPLNHVDADQFSKDYLKSVIATSHNMPVVVFIQDRLSLEDLTIHGNGLTPVGQNFKHLQSHLDEKPSLILPSVEDPVPAIRQVKGHKTIDASDYNDDIRHKLSGTRSDLTLVYLPPTVGLDNRPEALKANDELMSKAVGQFGKKKFVAIFTGKEPSWDAASEEASHHRIARSLLAVSPSTDTEPDDSFKATAAYGELRVVDPDGTYNVTNATLPWPPTATSSKDNETLTMVWKFTPDGSQVEGFSLLVVFQKLYNYWEASTLNATLKVSGKETQAALKPNYPITAGNGFSFSCGKSVLKSVKTNYTMYLTFVNLQLEPFSKSNSSNDSFAESFHCSTFFTLPLWMGFFTVLLFTAILGLGIFMLFQIKTMDRFDDPKGKTITVLQTE